MGSKGKYHFKFLGASPEESGEGMMSPMNRLKSIITRFCKEENGQSTTEYILILVLVLMIFNKVKQKVVQAVDTSAGSFEDKLTDALK